MGEVIADPKSEPVMTAPLEKALSDFGTHCNTALTAAGYMGASQAPSRLRTARSDAITPAAEEKTGPGSKAVKRVRMAQPIPPTASVRRGPNRSAIRPAGTMKAV